MDPVATVTAAGGLAPIAHLRSMGCSEYSLTVAVRAGLLNRVRNGWYTTLDAGSPRVVAVRSGGRLTGISALHDFGAWILDPPRSIHVAVPEHSSAKPAGPHVSLHWEDPWDPPSRPGVAALTDSLVRLALDESLEVSVPCFDWALATNRLDQIDFERVLLRLPRVLHGIASLVDGRSQSILESVARVRLQRSGWRVRTQVGVGLFGAIDVVIEDRVALELDGRAFHESTFESDRRKDLAITIEGRHPIRVSMSILREAWPDVEKAIAAALAARRFGDAEKSGELLKVPRRKLRARGQGHRLSSVSLVRKRVSGESRSRTRANVLDQVPDAKEHGE